MPVATRLVPSLVLASLLLAAGAAVAGGSSAPFGYTPDPALKTAGRADLELKIRDACASTQAKVQNASTVAVARPCGCYAARVLKSFDAGELDAYRNTGVFNDTGRGKALAAIDSCKLKRPV